MSELLYAVESAISMELVIEPADDCVAAGVTETLGAARAAITAVFDWLAEPSEDVAKAGLDAVNYGDNMGILIADARDVWSAMLAEMRKQALG